MIQACLDGILKRKEPFSAPAMGLAGTEGVLDKVWLRKGEVLQLHMDCMDAHGQVGGCAGDTAPFCISP